MSEDRDGEPEGELGLARRWVEAINRRDTEALMSMSAPDVVIHPTRMASRERYVGHAGLREWVAEVVAHGGANSVRMSGIRRQGAGTVLVVGELAVEGRTVSPMALLFWVADGAVTAMRAYLSDEATLREVGHIDA